MPVDLYSTSPPAFFLYDYSSGWQCSQELAQQTVNWNQPLDTGGSDVAQIWYVMPDALTPNSPNANQEQLFVDPELLLAGQPAGLQGSGPRWATCQSAFGGNNPPELVVAGGSGLASNCTTTSTTTPNAPPPPTTPPTGTLSTPFITGQASVYASPDQYSSVLATAVNEGWTVVCSTTVEVAGDDSMWLKVTSSGSPSVSGYVLSADVANAASYPMC